MDVKRRKTQDFAQKADSTAAGTGNWDVEEPVEPNEEVGKPHFLSGKFELRLSSATNPIVMEMGKSTPFGFLAQRNRFDGWYTTAEELNRKKDVVCLILSYPPMNSVNKERHKNWVRAVLKLHRKTRDPRKFPFQFEINALLDHKFDDIEAYVPPRIIEEMCKKTLAVTQPDEKVRNLAVNFATRQILEEIENPEVRRIRISGRDDIRVTAAVKGLPQIQKMFNVVVQVDVSSYSNIIGIERNIAAQLGFSDELEFNKLLEDTNFLIFLHGIHGRINLYGVGSKWWNSKNIQKIVCTTRSQTVHKRMAMDLEIRLEDHLLSRELFSLNVGKNVHSSGFRRRATDVVEKCSGRLLAVVLMARALKMVSDVIVWERASCILGLPHRAQMKDRALCNTLAFILGRLGSVDECVKYSAFHTQKEGTSRIDLILEWIRHALIKTAEEGEKIVQDLINAFVFESSQNRYSVQMRDEIHEVLVDLFRLEINTHFLLLCGRGLTKAPKDEAWEEAYEIHLMNNKLSELPKSPNCPHLCTLFLQNNSCLRVIHPLFVQRMPMLQILNLSHTKIRSLPQSFYGLV